MDAAAAEMDNAGVVRTKAPAEDRIAHPHRLREIGPLLHRTPRLRSQNAFCDGENGGGRDQAAGRPEKDSTSMLRRVGSREARANDEDDRQAQRSRDDPQHQQDSKLEGPRPAPGGQEMRLGPAAIRRGRQQDQRERGHHARNSHLRSTADRRILRIGHFRLAGEANIV
jgi:hypothetical protein